MSEAVSSLGWAVRFLSAWHHSWSYSCSSNRLQERTLVMSSSRSLSPNFVCCCTLLACWMAHWQIPRRRNPEASSGACLPCFPLSLVMISWSRSLLKAACLRCLLGIPSRLVERNLVRPGLGSRWNARSIRRIQRWPCACHHVCPWPKRELHWMSEDVG